jgi:short-subunit dehydrogenase
MTERPATLITGASSGIGSALAWQAAAAGHDLVLTARRGYLLTELAEALTARHGGRVLTIEADLSLPDGADRLVNEVLASGWQVDHLINNAGLGACGPVTGLPPGRLLELLQVNLVSLTILTRLLLPSMLDRGAGGILNVASLAAFQPGPDMAAYYASKAYVLSLSEALHEETRGSGFAREATMEDSLLFRFGLMSAEAVARAGWRGFQRGQRIIIPGWKNKLLATLGRLTPHVVSLRLIRRLHERA